MSIYLRNGDGTFAVKSYAEASTALELEPPEDPWAGVPVPDFDEGADYPEAEEPDWYGLDEPGPEPWDIDPETHKVAWRS